MKNLPKFRTTEQNWKKKPTTSGVGQVNERLMATLNDDIKLFESKHQHFGSNKRILNDKSSGKANTGHLVMQEWSQEPTNIVLNQASSPSRPKRDIYTQQNMHNRTGNMWNRSRDENLHTAGPSPRVNSMSGAQKYS